MGRLIVIHWYYYWESQLQTEACRVLAELFSCWPSLPCVCVCVCSLFPQEDKHVESDFSMTRLSICYSEAASLHLCLHGQDKRPVSMQVFCLFCQVIQEIYRSWSDSNSSIGTWISSNSIISEFQGLSVVKITGMMMCKPFPGCLREISEFFFCTFLYDVDY